MVGPYYTLGLTRNRPIRRRSMAGSTLTLIFGLDRILCAHLQKMQYTFTLILNKYAQARKHTLWHVKPIYIIARGYVKYYYRLVFTRL